MNSQVEQRARELLDAETRPLRSYSACEPLYPESVALRAVAAALASQPPVLDEREVKRAFTFAFAVGFQWASECSCVSAASIDEAWSEYTAIRNLGGPDDVA